MKMKEKARRIQNVHARDEHMMRLSKMKGKEESEVMDIHFGPIEFVLIGVIIMCVIGVLFSTRRKRLDSIKADEVGHGQHGTDRWMTIDEAKELYTVVKFPERFCDMSAEIKPGRLIYYDAKKREAIVDQTTSHSTIQAPTNTGKTTEVSVPNIIYNLMAGANMIIPCIKKELLELTWEQAGMQDIIDMS